MKIDFEAEGLLDCVEGEAREARRDLLERVAGEGVPLEELREAVEGGRITLLPVERELAGDGPRYTPREIAELAGVDLDLLQRATAALGIPNPDPDDRSLTGADLEEARRVGAFRDAGLPEEGIVQVARTIGMATARIAEANRDLVVRTLMQPGDTERDLALRFAAAAEHMLPLFEPTLSYAFRAHILEQIRRDVIGAADLAAGQPVNLASRLTGIANPGSVLLDAVAKEAAGESFDYSYAGEKRLKGFDSRAKLYRARRPGPK